MFRRKAKASGAPHIKRRTAGTSNELSFDVLDAASSNYDDKGRNPKEVKISRPGKSVGVVSLLFSKVHFPRKSDKGSASQSISAVSEELKTEEKVLKKREKAAKGMHESKSVSGAAAIGSGFAVSRKKKEKTLKKKEESSWKAKNEPYSAEAALAEVERRKARRKKRRIRARIIGAVTCVALVGVAGWLAYQRVMLTSDQDGQIKSLVSDISEVDENLVALDKLLLSPLGNEGTKDWDSLKSKLDESKDTLQSTAKHASELSENMNSNEMKVAVDQISVACDSRVEMIDYGTSIFDEAQKANSAADSLQNLWDSVMAADAKAREGTSKLSDASIDSSMAEAIDAMTTATESFEAALRELDVVESSYKGFDLGIQREYLQARIDSLGYAVACANALASRDKATAEEQAALYNSADKQAALLAADLPATPSDSVESAYDDNIADMQSQYEQARHRATVADDVIRDYLGADSK